MKKIIAISMASVCLVAMTVSSYAQGTVTFQNNTGQTPVTFGNLAPNAGQRVFGASGTFTYGLYVGDSTATSFSQLTLIDTVGNLIAANGTASLAGVISHGNVSGQGDVGAANGFAGLVGGTTYVIEVAGWTSSAGNSLAAALASGQSGVLVGSTGLGTVTAASGQNTPPIIFGPGAGQLGAFSLNPVPEPTTIALGGLGAAALLFFRRRK